VNYQRAFSTLGCGELALDEAFLMGARHHVSGIEVRTLKDSLDVPAVFAAEYGSPAELARHVASREERIVALDTSLRLVGGNDGDRVNFLRFVPWAEALGVRWLRVFDGGATADETEIAAAAEALGWWRRQRAQAGWDVDMMIETHDSLFTAEKIRRLVSVVPDAAILWDSHHTWKRGKEDPIQTWESIAPHVVHIHVKDSVSRRSEKFPYTYVPPGSGEFPMGPLAARLAAEFSGSVSLEWERMWHPDLPELDVALAAAERCQWW
jgi:sugar phosphate isomerase/epimerase